MINSLNLTELAACVCNCRACALAQCRKQVVFGSGNASAQLLFIGEAPGKNEDEGGKPFIGAAGKYLDELLALACLDREDIYITNVVKCRPPRNRNPREGEIAACAPILRAQIKVINPRYIVSLGNFATRFVLNTTEGISALRGRVHQAQWYRVFPVFHPAAAIYDRSKRPVLERDFKTLGLLVHGEIRKVL